MVFSDVKITHIRLPDSICGRFGPADFDREAIVQTRGNFMRSKAAMLIGLLTVFLLLAACGSGGDNGGGNNSGPGGSLSGGEREQPWLTDHGDSVSLTFPEPMFEGVELSQEFKTVNNYLDAVKNPDGTVTITMTKERQQEFLTAIKDTVDYNIEYFKSELDYLQEIRYAEDFTVMEIEVAADTDQSFLQELPYFFSLPFEQYQQMLGQEPQITISVLDHETGKVLLTMDFPEDER
jgi:hypothetical protein